MNLAKNKNCLTTFSLTFHLCPIHKLKVATFKKDYYLVNTITTGLMMTKVCCQKYSKFTPLLMIKRKSYYYIILYLGPVFLSHGRTTKRKKYMILLSNLHQPCREKRKKKKFTRDNLTTPMSTK